MKCSSPWWGAASPLTPSLKRRLPGELRLKLGADFLSSLPAKLEFRVDMPEARIAVCLNWVAVILAYTHWIFGTLVFSSTLFIGTLDALGVIARYVASALVCRMILLVELAGIRGLEETETAKLSSSGTGRGGPEKQ